MKSDREIIGNRSKGHNLMVHEDLHETIADNPPTIAQINKSTMNMIITAKFVHSSCLNKKHQRD